MHVQVSHAVSAILFLVKNLIFIRYFFIKNNFFRLDSFFRFRYQSIIPASVSWKIIIVKECIVIVIIKMIVK